MAKEVVTEREPSEMPEIVLYLELGGGYMGIYIRKNSLSYTLKICAFVCNLYRKGKRK